MINKFNLLIPAGGKGSRVNLKYPKSLIKINSKTILELQISLFSTYDKNPTLIINKKHEKIFNNFINKNQIQIETLIQDNPIGMGNAVLNFNKSKFYSDAENILLVWSDIPFLSKNTIKKTISNHIKYNNDFTFPTIYTEDPYTIVIRDNSKNIKEVIETRELKKNINKKLEREIGFFVFKKKPLYSLLNSNLSGKINKITKEHSFLYIIKHLVKRGYKVQGIPLATIKDTYSINTLDDLDFLKKKGLLC